MTPDLLLREQFHVPSTVPSAFSQILFTKLRTEMVCFLFCFVCFRNGSFSEVRKERLKG